MNANLPLDPTVQQHLRLEAFEVRTGLLILYAQLLNSSDL